MFRYGKDKKTAETGDLTPKNDTPTVDEPKGSIDKRDLETIATLVNNFQNENSRKNFYAWLDNNFKTMSLENLTYSQGKIVLKRLGAK